MSRKEDKEKKVCSIWWCRKPHYAFGYCIVHYRATVRYGTPFGKQDGFHYEQQKKVNEVVKKARTVSKAMMDSLRISGPVCPYCHRIETHTPECPVHEAQFILEETR